jgi:glycine oxidase
MKTVMILGQGIAGSLLAYELIKLGISVVVLDNGNKWSATKVAAGLVDGITGKRFALSEGVPDSIFEIERYYAGLEKEFGCQLYSKIPSHRLFIDEENKAKYERRKQHPDYAPFYKCEIPAGSNEMMQAPLGGVSLNYSGMLNTNLFLEKLREFLEKHNAYQLQDVEWADITITPESITAYSHQAKIMVDCRGYQASLNPLFADIAYRHAKGEILQLKIPSPDHSEAPHVWNRNHWLARLHDKTYKFGATYEWDDLNPNPTESGKRFLANACKDLMKQPYEIIGHQAAIRCIPSQNIPVVKFHDTVKNCALFTGLGSKGVLLGPKYAKKLVQLIRHMDVKVN